MPHLQAKGGCCGSASATKGDASPAATTARPAAPQQDGELPPAHKQAGSAAQGGAVPTAPPTNTANGRSDNSHGSQQPAVTAPAALSAASAAAPAHPPSQGGVQDFLQPLDGERKMPRARPKANTADKVAGLPTVGGQRRAQAIAAEAAIGGGASCIFCHTAAGSLPAPETVLHRHQVPPAEAPAVRNLCAFPLQGEMGMQAPRQGKAAPAFPLPLMLGSQAHVTALPQRALRSTGVG